MRTKDKLKSWGCIDEDVCVFCNKDKENVDHLFFTCDVSRRIFKKVLEACMIFKDVERWRREWAWYGRKASGKSIMARVRRIAFISSIYQIWRARNRKVFENEAINSLAFRVVACYSCLELFAWAYSSPVTASADTTIALIGLTSKLWLLLFELDYDELGLLFDELDGGLVLAGRLQSVGLSYSLLECLCKSFLHKSRLRQARVLLTTLLQRLEKHGRLEAVCHLLGSSELFVLWSPKIMLVLSEVFCVSGIKLSSIHIGLEWELVGLVWNSFGSLRLSESFLSMLQFSDFISASSLIESPLQGRHFTWQNSVSKSKLDRCFTSTSLLASWPHSILQALPRSYSDHIPIAFKSEVVSDWGPKPFKSINAWWDHSAFPSFILNAWNNISVNFPPGDLVVKLRQLRSMIKVWNKEVFGDLNTKLLSVDQEIQTLEVASDFNALTDMEVDRLSYLRAENNLISNQLESLWRQKSRVKWNLHGDRNTKFFHTSASVHSKNSFISELFVNGIRFSSAQGIKDQVHLFYKNLYKRSNCVVFSLASLPILSLSEPQGASLTSVFSEDEVLSTLLGQDDNKAPGPDGFNYFFYNKAWHQHGFLGAYPMFIGASELSDFRPISFINGIFKLLSKVLANRLFPLLPSIISANQFGFIKGRNIHDCRMIASEILHLASRRKEQLFLIKLDFKKAFDSISWDFILMMMARMNFPKLWIDWISLLFNSSQLSVLVSGSPTHNFFMGKGVREGDPISPMLFVLAVEGLKALFDKAISHSFIDGVHIDGYPDPVSILQFADDTLIFIPNDMNMIVNLLRILRCFEKVSSLHINYKKSSILGVNVDDASLQMAASILNCPISSLPIMYLGLPLSLRPIKAALWQPVVTNFHNQLASWKGNLLSPAGRLILVKACLSSLPVYFMCSFYMPQSVLLLLDRCMKIFWWCGSPNGKGLCKISWSKVCLPFSLGGLNITPFRIKNKSLLYKWIWKLISPSNQLWFSVICQSCSLNSWHDIEASKYYLLSHTWKGIFNACVKDSEQWKSFTSCVSFRVGTGDLIKFWHDVWLYSVPLRHRFPNLYRIRRSKNSMVVDFFSQGAAVFERTSWNRRLRIGEEEDLELLLSDLRSVSFPGSPDEAYWQNKVSGQLQSQLNLGIFIPSIWKLNILPRIQFFMWLVAWDRISCNASLGARGILNPSLIGCSVCHIEETSSHILLHCSFAWNLWCFIFSKCGIIWVSPYTTESFFILWNDFSLNAYKDLWKLIWFFCVWELWKARSRRVFRGDSTQIEALAHLAISRAVMYYACFHPRIPYSGNDVFRCLNCFVKLN
ncbi:uncharacterized protein LOC126661653 [Mercurialis annua]|uniref:uncharacterized protein LOC126661653 n=1 Tax=Mercurialis annua TaxID=3986 RepID=UPI00216047E6|nr:uncharacterized protein LOC126661653 [Mercurialis annua]